MGVLRGKTWINIAATLLVALVFFSCSFSLTQAQDVIVAEQMQDAQAQQAADSGKAVGFDTVSGLVYDGLTSIGGLVLSLGGKLLDVSLSWFVYGMKDTLDTLHLTSVISEIWELVRDLFNLFFIFGLIFIGFKIILDIDDSRSKTTLVTLIIAALLINFSLYVTQVVVDFSNIASAEIGQLLMTSEPERSTVFGMKISNISSGFIAAVDLNSLASTTLSKVNELSTGKTISLPEGGLGIGHALAMGLTIALMLILIGFVFAAGAIIMFTRFMYLIFLMMFSPVMFLGWVLPGFASRTKDWWNALFTQAFVGPAYLFMLYVALVALKNLMNSPVTSGDTSIIAFIMSSLIVSAFVWAALLVAQKMGAAGADMAVNTGQGWGKSIRGGVTGTAGRLAIGRHADRLNQAMEARGWNEKNPLRRMVSTAASSKYGGSYSAVDARGSKEKAGQKQARYEQLYGKQKQRKIGVGPLSVSIPTGAREGGLTNAIKVGAASNPESDERIAMEKAITGASSEQLIEMLGKHKLGSVEYENIIQHMSASQFEAVMKAKADELDDGAKAEIGKKRNEFVTAAVTTAGGISKASDSQLKVLGAKEIEKNAADLKQSQFDAIVKAENKDYTETEKDRIRKARENQLWDRFISSPNLVFDGKKDGEIAKLPEKVLTHIDSARYITQGALKKMLDDDTVTPSVRSTIKQNLQTRRAGITNKVSDDFWDTPLGKNF